MYTLHDNQDRSVFEPSSYESRPEPKPKVSVLIVTFRSQEEIGACIESLRSQECRFPYEVIIIDNASGDGTVESLYSMNLDERFQIIAHDVNCGFAAANNIAYRYTRGEILILINPDSELKNNALQAAVDYLERNPSCGICGGLLLGTDGHVIPSARKFPDPVTKLQVLSGLAERFPKSRFWGQADFTWAEFDKPFEVDWVPGAFTALRRCLIEELGFFDERFYLYYEETDLCLRAKRHGWKVCFIPDSVVFHEGGASSRKSSGTEFDGAGSQIFSFRTRAECLFHHKNNGSGAVLANMGVEWLWHQARQLVNLRPGETCRLKRAYSRKVVLHIEMALRDTKWGSVCPPRPWKIEPIADRERKPSLFAQIKADLETHGGDWTSQGFWALAVYRLGRWLSGIRFTPLRKLLSLIYQALFKMVQVCAGIELPCEAEIGDGLRIDHFGGIIVSRGAVLGRGCVLRQGVNIGLKDGSELGAPRLGDYVDVGAGAKILGPITIGDNVDIGANAVVITDVPADSIAVGIPARILPKKKGEAA